MVIYENLKSNLERLKELSKSLDESGLTTQFRLEVLNCLFQESPIVSWIKDADGKFFFASDSFLKRFNLKEVRGRTDAELFPESVAVEIRNNDLDILKTNKMIELREHVPTPDGVMYEWLVFKFPITVNTDRFVCGFAIKLNIMETTNV